MICGLDIKNSMRMRSSFQSTAPMLFYILLRPTHESYLERVLLEKKN